MRKFQALLLFLAITAVFCSAQIGEKKLRLVSLHANGSQLYSEAQVLQATGLQLNEEVTQHDLEEAANELGETGMFVGVHFQFMPVAEGVSATYQVTDNVGTAPVIFENFVWFAPDQLENELRTRVPLFQGRLPNAGSLLQDVRLALQALINNKNIPGTVKTNVNGQLGQFISISYIVEDVEPRIAAIKFQGAQQLDSALLEDAAHSLLQTAYSQSAVQTFCNSNLKSLYLARGFLKVRFGDLVYKLANESVQEPLVEVTVPVDEGPQYHFAGVTWTGNTISSPQELQKLISLQNGDLANAVRLEKDLAGLRQLYGPRGYLGVTHKVQAHLMQDGTASFEVQLHEGVPYQMGKLTIRGVDQEHKARIQQLWKLAPGAAYDDTYPSRFISELIKSHKCCCELADE
ncbi:MAG TPA: POTRA domain-containing protein [Terriglobales bacterium]|nr:POTRA domain-containing protein [Terriglobales bacterium]